MLLFLIHIRRNNCQGWVLVDGSLGYCVHLCLTEDQGHSGDDDYCHGDDDNDNDNDRSYDAASVVVLWLSADSPELGVGEEIDGFDAIEHREVELLLLLVFIDLNKKSD